MRGWSITVGVAFVLAGATIPRIVPGLGEPTWHHNVSLAASLGLYGLASWLGRADHRRHQALGVAFWTTLAIVTGFLILYLKQDLKDTGYKDWAKFWHVAWSWLALWYAMGHTWINRVGLTRAIKRTVARVAPLVGYVTPLLLILFAIPLTWSDAGARALREPQYIPLTLWTWLVVVAVAYAAWLLHKARPHWRSIGRVNVQNFVGAWLIPMTFAANLSGIPILYFGTKDTALKYVAKYWHTWPSIAMAVLIFAHTIHFWPGLIRHWRSSRRLAAHDEAVDDAL